MEYRKLGKTGLKISEVSLGSWVTFGDQIDMETSKELMHLAYAAGVNFFDNAESYADGASEEVMGQILQKTNWPRDSYLVSSKVYFGAGGTLPTQKGLSRKHVVEACHAALRRLKVEYLDLYLCHRPDKDTPIEETVQTMHNLIVQGKVLYWGTSEWSAQEIMEAHMVARTRNLIGPVLEQAQYNMLERNKIEKEFIRLYDTVGLGTTVWSPLASGVLTGKYNNGKANESRLRRKELDWLSDKLLVKETLKKVEKISELASDLGITMPELAIAWCLKNPNVSTAILGASRPDQLKETLRAPEKCDLLTPGVMNELDEILGNRPDLPPF